MVAISSYSNTSTRNSKTWLKQENTDAVAQATLENSSAIAQSSKKSRKYINSTWWLKDTNPAYSDANENENKGTIELAEQGFSDDLSETDMTAENRDTSCQNPYKCSGEIAQAYNVTVDSHQFPTENGRRDSPVNGFKGGVNSADGSWNNQLNLTETKAGTITFCICLPLPLLRPVGP